jgi:DNA-binding NtrC family response regulator
MQFMTNFDVLIVDDEKEMRQMLSRLLRIEGFNTKESSTAKDGIDQFNKHSFHCVLCDVKLPDGYGVDLVKDFKRMNSHTEVVLLTAYGKVNDGVAAIKNGAFDYLVKGEDNDRIIQTVTNACEKSALNIRIVELQGKLSGGIRFNDIIGESERIKESIELARKVATTDTPVLITGETGSGKEIFARAIHSGSNRSGGVFLALNCGSFSRELLESELFGYRAGAFTGAVKDKKGLIDEASGGTLFLDEVGEIPHELQSKFLRVLESGEYFRIGDTSPKMADVRLITATNRDLAKEVESGNFRSDLYYRLSAFLISLPDLNSRREDILLLADFFVKNVSAKLKKIVLGMTDEFKELLVNHNWKGNIRELRNVIERACILEESETLTAESLPLEFKLQSSRNMQTDITTLAEAEENHIRRVMQQTNDNKPKAAKLLDIGLSTLYMKLKEYNI